MKFDINTTNKTKTTSELLLLSAFSTKNNKIDVDHWPKNLQQQLKKIKSSTHYRATTNEIFFFSLNSGLSVLVMGLGNKTKVTKETVRKAIATSFNQLKNANKQVEINLDQFMPKEEAEEYLYAILEAIHMANYSYNKYKKDTKQQLQTIVLTSSYLKKAKLQTIIKQAAIIGESITVAKNFVNCPPNSLTSEAFAKAIEKDAKKLPHTKIKILGKAALKKEKMNLFLSVNAGSAYEPKLVHLTYTPKKVNNKTKHIALVGKGLTFDSGGYSLKPSASMQNMKFDMAGAATVYAAFRAAVLLGANIKISCFLGMTDNMVNSLATVPDSVVVGRNGKSVEILNTDAEGRLVLADVLSYACDQKPDEVIDAATLTGAVLVSLGHEVCGLMSNNQELANNLLEQAQISNEYLWQLPIIPEFHDDIKSPIADLKNIGSSRFGGSSKAAAFLENFVTDKVKWAHLDIAGVGDSQGHLPYCPKKGASGLMIRTLIRHLIGKK